MNTYIISAESYHILNNELNKIIKDNNPIYFNMYKSSIKDAITEASYYSLDSTKKYLVVTNADFLGTGKSNDEVDIINDYLDKPNPNTILIFTTLNGIDLRKKVVKRIKDNNCLINIPKLDKRGINDLITNYLKEYKYSIDYQTINYIMDNSYSNIDIIYNELGKIMLFYNNPCKINYNDVVKIVGKELDSNNFHFVSAVIDKDLELSLKLFNDLKVYKVEPTVLISLLAREYRLMYYVKLLYKRHSKDKICSYLGIQDWQLNKIYNNSIKYQERELLDNLVQLCNIDMNIKKGIYDKETSLISFILDACS